MGTTFKKENNMKLFDNKNQARKHAKPKPHTPTKTQIGRKEKEEQRRELELASKVTLGF